MNIKTILNAALLVILGLGLASCQTMHGFGQDMKNAGENLENAASE